MTKTELLEKFFNNECSAEEARVALEYLKENPQLLWEYLGKEEWDLIDDNLPLHPEIEDSIRKEVLSKTTKRKLTILSRSLVAAASIAALVMLGYIFFNKTALPLTEITSVTAQKSSTLIERIVNSEPHAKKIVLADKSVVALYPGASIEFPKQFKTDRSVHLNGKAIFDVAKDKEHLFTVYSSGIATTAIGTRFLVNSNGVGNKLNIQLYEGEVVVRAVDSLSEIKGTHLFPGQQCFIDLYSRNLVVQSIQDQPIVNKTTTQIVRSTDPSQANPTELNFDQTPLTEVFETIQKIYGKAIVFDSKEINGTLFTGKFAWHENPTVILKVITAMNGLTSSEEDGKIRVYAISADSQFSGHDYEPMEDNSVTTVTINKPDLQLNRQHELASIEMLAVPKSEFVTEKDGVMYFKNSTLKNVIRKLTEAGRYQILFNEEDVASKFFTGQIKVNRSMINILPVICRMNGLKVTKANGKYFIIKL